ncbi:MAG: hypothetical protein NVS4B6_19180 [Mycobacterium sp.]
MEQIGSVAFHRVAELLMGHMDQAKSRGEWRMAAAYAQLAADAEGRALQDIPADRVKTRMMISQSQLSLVDCCLQYLAKVK